MLLTVGTLPAWELRLMGLLGCILGRSDEQRVSAYDGERYCRYMQKLHLLSRPFILSMSFLALPPAFHCDDLSVMEHDQ